MKIESVTEDNAAFASQVFLLSWQKGYKGIVPPQYLDDLTIDRWRVRLTEPWQNSFVLSDNDKGYVAAISVAGARDKAMKGWGEVVALYVRPDSFRRGYGKVLFSYAINYLHRNGYKQIYLWVLKENHRGRAFYESMGFSHNGDEQKINIGGSILTELRYFNADR